MAKLKKKVLNNKNKKQAQRQQAENNQLKARMKELVEQEAYADAMDVMAEIAQTGRMDGETMYMGALCYFKTDDCDRAARWVSNALSREPGSYQAKLLLARICLVEDRVHEGMQVLESVLSQAGSRLSDQEREELIDDLYYFKYAAKEELQGFPQVQKLLGMEVAPAETEAAEVPETVADQAEILPAAEAVFEGKDSNAGSDADEADEAGAGCEVCAGIEAGAVAGQPKVESAGATEEQTALAADDIIKAVQAKPVALVEKVKLLNNFAAGCYQAEDYAQAYTLLAEALKIDTGNEAVLRNMAYTCLAMGEVEKAMAFVSQMPMVDFGCIQTVKKAGC